MPKTKYLPKKENEDIKKQVGVYIALPVPSRDVLEFMPDSNLQFRYMECIEHIAKLESETLVKIGSKKFSSLWKIVAILCAMFVLLSCLLIGNGLHIEYKDLVIKSKIDK